MNTALDRSMNDQQNRIQMLAHIASQRSNAIAAFNMPSNDINNERADEAQHKEEMSPMDTPAGTLAIPGSFTARRTDAISKLKRAASQREMRGRGPDASPSGAHTPLEEINAGSASNSLAHEEGGGGVGLSLIDGINRFETLSPFLARPLGAEGSKSVSPIPPGMMRLEQLRSGSPSPQRSLRDGAATPETGSLLNRSRSQRGDARSPLPSLEQLRARILHERATAGLARSASTSASSAAARAYALEKLLGESPRQGAVSPVSDTAEDQEEDTKMENSISGLNVANSNQRILLRRSRTIGGLSAEADAQRKAAFVQALDEGVPEDVKSIKRSSRRFAKAPPGSRISTSSKPSDPPIHEENVVPPIVPIRDEVQKGEAPVERLEADLDRTQSQRQIVRAEMMRKLSVRGRNGQKSPLPALTADNRGDQGEVIASDVSSSPLPPVTPPAAVSLALPPISPSTNLLTVPGLGFNAQSPSSRPSTGMTSLHESDRNRASEMARLMGEEAFEYERLLEMGYTTDDAYDRVASARSGSYMELSANASPRSYQGEFSHSHLDQQQHSPLRDNSRRLSQMADDSFQKVEEPFTESAPNTTQSRQAEWPIAHPTFASIPLGLSARRRSSASGINTRQSEEVLFDNEILLPSNRRAAWPESVASTTTFGTTSSPKHSSGSTKRDSEGGPSSVRYRPMNLNLQSVHSVERIEEILTPGFLEDFGNPLDFSTTAGSSNAQQDSAGLRSESEDEGLSDGELGGMDQTEESGADDYLEKVDQMTRKLGKFTRRNNNNATRSDRDAVVQQSSAAQVVAAASQDAQRLETPSMIMARSLTAPLPYSQHQQQVNSMANANEFVPSLVGTPRFSPNTSLRPLPGTRTHSATNSTDSFQHFTNGKLSPFPGLFTQSNPSAQTSNTSLVRKPSPLMAVPDASMRKAVNFEDYEDRIDEKKVDTVPSKLPTFFTTLRRKASNAASRAHDNLGNTGQASTSPTSKKFGSLLRRRPSEAKHLEVTKEPDSPTMSMTSLTSNNTLKQAPSNEQIIQPPVQLAPAAIPIRTESLANRIDDQSIQAAPQTMPSPIYANTAALHRYSRMLTSPREAGSVAGVLGLTKQDIDYPPRSFLFATPVLQVMTTSTVKDRYLFIFSDVLIIAKPIAPPEATIVASSTLPTLEWTFSVKDVLDIGYIKHLTAPTDERRRPARNVALMNTFVQEFRLDPQHAIDSLIGQSSLAKTPATIAQLLHQTPELDRQQLTNYLFNDPSRWDVTTAFIELERLSGVSIESALRSLLLEIRFPSRREYFEDLLITFARHWTSSNRSLIKETFSEQIAIDLVFAIMTLNDALHGENQSTPAMFSEPNPNLSKEEFLQSFRPRDEDLVLSDRTLSRIYLSISQEAVQQCLLDNEASHRSAARILSPGIPSRLVYGVNSSPIRISIPQCDPDFTIRLYGEDLVFQPQVLSFVQGTIQEFRILSKSLGPKSIVFIKSGRNARYYQTSMKTEIDVDFVLPRSASLVVERAFKQHCFTIAQSGGKKYTLSVEGETKKNRCVDTIKTGMVQLANDTSRKESAHSLALHVLKEALMEAEVSPILQRSASAAVPTSSSRLEMGALNRAPSDSRAFGGTAIHSRMQIAPVNRKESVSKHYYQFQGKREKGLAPTMEFNEEEPNSSNAISSLAPLKGEELIVTVKQNSLLSVIVARLRQDHR